MPAAASPSNSSPHLLERQMKEDFPENPFADLEILKSRVDDLCARVPELDLELQVHYRRRLDALTKPVGSLGRLEELACRWACLRHPHLESIEKKCLLTFAADHGISSSGVSRYPREVTAQMVVNFLQGGAAISVLCRHYGIQNLIVDVGVDGDFPPHPHLQSHKVRRGTRHFLCGPSMTSREALETIETGVELARGCSQRGVGLIGCGEMGIGNSTSAAAVYAALTGMAPEEVTGRGTGVDDAGYARKLETIRSALVLHSGHLSHPLEILVSVGGYELAAILGLILGSAACTIPVVVDGYIASAAAALALGCCPLLREWLFFSHRSREKGHGRVLKWLGANPILDLDLRLGEGTGAAIAMDLISTSLHLMTEMATFEQAGVSREND